ncbi:unnamed protein product [Scytosiphon promiscuus]
MGRDLMRHLQLRAQVQRAAVGIFREGLGDAGGLFMRQDGGASAATRSAGGDGVGRAESRAREASEDGEEEEEEEEEDDHIMEQGEEIISLSEDDGEEDEEEDDGIDPLQQQQLYVQQHQQQRRHHQYPHQQHNNNLADVIPPWVKQPESPPRRETVKPIPVSSLLADGGGGSRSRAASLLATLSFRTRLRRDILAGNIGAATEALQKERPGLLEKRADVRFALKCQEFIELVKKRELNTAVLLAQRSRRSVGGAFNRNKDQHRRRASSAMSPQPRGRNGELLKPGGGGRGSPSPYGNGHGNSSPGGAGNSPTAGHTGGSGRSGSRGARGGAGSTPPPFSIGAKMLGVGEAQGGPGHLFSFVLRASLGVTKCVVYRKVMIRGGYVGGMFIVRGEAGAPTQHPRVVTRKRRTRSYDPVRATADDGQRNPHHHRHHEEDDSDAWASPDRGATSALPGGGVGGGGDLSVFGGRGGVLPASLFGAPSVYDSKLMAVMGLLAYTDPASSPLGHLVSGLQNQAIADKVNDAVLGECIAAAALCYGRRSDALATGGSNTSSVTDSSINGAQHQQHSQGTSMSSSQHFGKLSSTSHPVPPTSGLEFTVRHLLATRQASRETVGEAGQAAGCPRFFF